MRTKAHFHFGATFSLFVRNVRVSWPFSFCERIDFLFDFDFGDGWLCASAISLRSYDDVRSDVILEYLSLPSFRGRRSLLADTEHVVMSDLCSLMKPTESETDDVVHFYRRQSRKFPIVFYRA